ncbi:MAG TPA: hypothetical protein VF809_02720 [Candidatus Saccharimonadales bacterium]
MSLETDRWAELSPTQADFYGSMIGHADRLIYSPSAQEIGIVPMSGMRYSYQVGEEVPIRAVIWPDPNTPNTECIVSASTQGDVINSFVRVMQTPTSWEMEGVVLNIEGPDRYSNLYGQQIVMRHEADGLRPHHCGSAFVSSAVELATHLRATETTGPYNVVPIRILGIESDVSARLLRSISSLAGNLVIAGSMLETESTSSPTYDIARALLKMTINSIPRGRERTPEGGTILANDGKPRGAIFESSNDGIVAIYQMGGYPNTIALTTAIRPSIGARDTFVEQYQIQSRGAVMEFRTLPAEPYSMQSVIGALAMFSSTGENSGQPREPIDVDSRAILEQKMIGLMSERSRLKIG